MLIGLPLQVGPGFLEFKGIGNSEDISAFVNTGYKDFFSEHDNITVVIG